MLWFVMSHDLRFMRQDKNKILIREYGGLEIIVEVIIEHTEDEVVQRACAALKLLSRTGRLEMTEA